MMKRKVKKRARNRRHVRIRGKISGTGKRPRLCVFRSNQHIYAQLVDDEKNKVLATASDLKVKAKATKETKVTKVTKGTKEANGAKETKEGKESRKLTLSFKVGELIAKKAKDLKIEEVVFDRGGYKYHGRVKSLADGARAEGLKF